MIAMNTELPTTKKFMYLRKPIYQEEGCEAEVARWLIAFWDRRRNFLGDLGDKQCTKHLRYCCPKKSSKPTLTFGN